MAGGVVAFEGELNFIVKEYLEFNQYDKTRVVFERECVESGKPVLGLATKTKTNHSLVGVQNDFLILMKTGKRKDFFRLWNQHISEKIRNEDAVSQKLEFYLNIYFAIYPLKYGSGDTDSGMNELKHFLETRGAALSQTTEFLPFYALPFVPNPRTHPSYRDLFSEKWVPDLKKRLEKFLTLTLQSTSQPRLFELYKGSGAIKSQSNQVMEQKAVDAEKKSVAYLKRYNRVQADYHNLISITADLVDSLERTVQGNPVSPEYLQQICMRLFSNQVRQSVDFSRPGTAGDVLRQSVAPPQGLQHNEITAASTLDYDKVRTDLTSAPDRRRALLLQALRWKLTKSTPEQREALLTAYITHDLLGSTNHGSYRQSIMDLLHSSSTVIHQYTARLFNTVASLCEGRSYLSQNPALLKTLISSLKSQKGDNITRENILGCIQKLSLRRQSQTLMIEEGIILWLVTVLEDDDSLSDYLLEYSVALLMNLCLRTAGKRKCIENAHMVLKVLSDLLGHENQEIIPYVNGTLYSILAIPSIREEARAMGMEEILKCFIKEDQPDMNRQIEFIIKQLNSDEDPEEVESDDEDDEEDEEDQDAMEADLDKAEIIKPQNGELSGERLLNSYYVNSTSSANRKRRPTTEAVKNEEELLRRPVTPSHMKGGDQPVVHVQPRSRPPTGRPSSSRSDLRSDRHRPPTRSGSRPGTQESMPGTPYVESDPHASEIVSKATGSGKKLATAIDNNHVKPSRRALEKMQDQNPDVEEYSAAFGTRPRITRTPDVGGRPTSRGSVGDGPTPQPKYSDSLPTPRPGSGGSGQTPASPSPRTPRTPRTPSTKSHGRGR